MIAGCGVPDAADRTTAISGDVFIRAELVAGEERADAEIEKAAPGRKYGGIGQKVPPGPRTSCMLRH